MVGYARYVHDVRIYTVECRSLGQADRCFQDGGWLVVPLGEVVNGIRLRSRMTKAANSLAVSSFPRVVIELSSPI